jgi:hypothetical protein
VDGPGSRRGELFLCSLSPSSSCSRRPTAIASFLSLSAPAIRLGATPKTLSRCPAPASPYFRSTLKEGRLCLRLERDCPSSARGRLKLRTVVDCNLTLPMTKRVECTTSLCCPSSQPLDPVLGCASVASCDTLCLLKIQQSFYTCRRYIIRSELNPKTCFEKPSQHLSQAGPVRSASALTILPPCLKNSSI